MTTLQEKIQKLSTVELKELTSNYEQFEREASISGCLLRSIAEDIQGHLGISGLPIVLWMEKVAFEAYRERCKRLQHLLGEFEAG